jgi:hypothetical protein
MVPLFFKGFSCDLRCKPEVRHLPGESGFINSHNVRTSVLLHLSGKVENNVFSARIRLGRPDQESILISIRYQLRDYQCSYILAILICKFDMIFYCHPLPIAVVSYQFITCTMHVLCRNVRNYGTSLHERFQQGNQWKDT